MKNYVIINGVNSNTITGLMINELPPITKPQMRAIQEEIDGRDGDITTNLGYSAYDKTITIGLFGTGYDIDDIVAFFNGEGTIVFSNEDDKYYNFKILNQIDYVALQKFKSASITFHCQPFKYPLTETPLEIEYSYVSDEGETISLNTAPGLMKVNLLGNTSQETTTGKNLFDYSKFINNGGATSTSEPNKITVVNANGGENKFAFFLLGKDELLGKTITIHSNMIGTTGGIRLFFGGSTNNIVSGISGIYSPSDSKWTLTIANSFPSNCDRVLIVFYSNFSEASAGTTMIFENTQVELGSSVSTYEPYTNGASPNPDYPQEVNVVSGDNKVVVSKKNLWQGESSYTGVTTVAQIQQSLSKTTYTISYNQSVNGTVQLNFKKNGVTKQSVTIFNNAGDVSETFTVTESFDEIWLYLSVEMTISNIQIEKGSSATTYETPEFIKYPIKLGLKNMFDGEIELGSINPVDGSLVVNNSRTRSVNYIKVKPNTPYYYTREKGGIRWIVGYKSDKTGITDGTMPGNPSGIGSFATDILQFTFTTTATTEYIKWYDTADTDLTETITMVEGNKPQTLSDNPIELCKIGTYQDKFIRNSGKNLVEGEIVNGTIDGSGYIGQNVSFTMWYAKITQGETYTVSTDDGNLVAGFFYTQPSVNSTAYNNTRLVQENKTFTAPITGYIAFRTTVNYTLAQCELGNSSTPYEPYGNGDWYLRQEIDKYVFGNEVINWTSGGQVGNNYYFYTDQFDGLYNGANFLCDKLITNVNASETENVIRFSSSWSNIRIYISTNLIENTITSLNNWLANNKPIIYIPLATPTYTKIEGTLKDELDEVYRASSYKGQTNISQNNNDKAFILNVVAMEEGSNEVQVNNIGNTYAKPLIALEGTGNINIYLDNTQILQANVEDKMNIDIAKLEAYNPDTSVLLNRQVIGNYNSMTIPSGTSIIRMDGELTKATITNYTRWL